jgi:hypothetical protein
VPSRADDDEGIAQGFLRVVSQDGSKLGVNRLDSGGRDAEIEDPCLKMFDEDETAEITVPCNEDTFLAARQEQQVAVVGLYATDLCYGDNIVTASPQEASSYGVDILIEEKPHTGTRT